MAWKSGGGLRVARLWWAATRVLRLTSGVTDLPVVLRTAIALRTPIYGSSPFSSSFHGPSATQLAGSIWYKPTWQQDPIDPKVDVQIKSVSSATYFGQANYIYTLNSLRQLSTRSSS